MTSASEPAARAPLSFGRELVTPVTGTERIGVLDVLRGIALLGMFLVHFNDNAAHVEAASGLTTIYQRTVSLFFEERFWTMFAILFGVGFAVQLRRAEARGRSFESFYLRRLAGLAAIGFIAHAVFGFNVLLGYAVWGLPLLAFRNWSMKALVLALVLSSVSGCIFMIARTGYRVAVVGESGYRSERAALMTFNQTFLKENRAAQDAPGYPTVLQARLRHMRWFYVQPFSFLPVNTLTFFLIGVIGFRLGFFENPAAHRRALVAISIFGVVSWLADLRLLQDGGFDSTNVRDLTFAYVRGGFGLVRNMWLAFAYISVVLLLVSYNPAWVRRLGAFAWTGRMALTIYMVQIATLDLLFSNYALHVTLTPLQALGTGLVFFALNAAFSRWWLARFRFGPFEWLWRSITYGQRQPWRIDARAATLGAT